jgi:hypothetical protein
MPNMAFFGFPVITLVFKIRGLCVWAEVSDTTSKSERIKIQLAQLGDIRIRTLLWNRIHFK